MSTLSAYRRADGRIGIRNQIFVLPSVVCANQVALDVAKKIPAVKYIEHQHGCAQIGDDLLLAHAVFKRMALHPNVYSSVLVGLGCEAVSAKVVAEQARGEHKQKVELVVIQESGGTLGAENAVERWIHETEETAAKVPRIAASWSELVVGIQLESSDLLAGRSVSKMLDKLWELGVRMVVPEADGSVLKRYCESVSEVPYGEESEKRAWVMTGDMPPLEASTGLAVAGAHVLIHVVTEPHAFGNPLAPTVRLCADEDVYRAFSDDFDGLLSEKSNPYHLVESLTEYTNGKLTVAEELGMDDFALHRVGPTV